MTAIEQIDSLVKLAFSYSQYEGMAPEYREALYDMYKKKYGDKKYIRINGAMDSAVYRFMDIHENELNKAQASKARRDYLVEQQKRQQEYSARKAREEAARKKREESEAASRRKAQDDAYWRAWEAKNRDLLNPSTKQVAQAARVDKTPIRGTDSWVADFANATGNTVIGQNGVTLAAPKGGIFGRR